MNTNSRMSYVAQRIENIPNTNKKFDLHVGDKVKINRTADKDGRFWTVTGIYDRMFMCKDRLGIHQTFTKLEYLLNEVVKVRSYNSNGEEISNAGSPN